MKGHWSSEQYRVTKARVEESLRYGTLNDWLQFPACSLIRSKCTIPAHGLPKWLVLSNSGKKWYSSSSKTLRSFPCFHLASCVSTITVRRTGPSLLTDYGKRIGETWERASLAEPKCTAGRCQQPQPEARDTSQSHPLSDKRLTTCKPVWAITSDGCFRSMNLGLVCYAAMAKHQDFWPEQIRQRW